MNIQTLSVVVAVYPPYPVLRCFRGLFRGHAVTPLYKRPAVQSKCILYFLFLIVRNNLELYFLYIFSLFFTVRLHFMIRNLHQTQMLDIININVYITYIRNSSICVTNLL